MIIMKPTIGGAIASITRGIRHLEAVITSADKDVDDADEAISKAANKKADAAIVRERAARIKAKLEELVA